jgi:hypothetical protein
VVMSMGVLRVQENMISSFEHVSSLDFKNQTHIKFVLWSMTSRQ